MSEHFSSGEMMTVAAARLLADGQVCFVGIGRPSVAANLARRTHAAQIDRAGNINSTVIGDYDSPRTRLPGAGGAPEIAASAREVIVILQHSKRAFVERCDFVTSPGRRVRTVITDLGILEMAEGGELELASVHPGVSVEDLQTAATGWELRVRPSVAVTPPPSGAEVSALRSLLAA